MHGPDPNEPWPLPHARRVVFLKDHVRNPCIVVGDYTYYDDPDGPENFELNVLYHFDFMGDSLIIGRYCAIAAGVVFLMNGANHDLSGFSSYPFYIFGHGWEGAAPESEAATSRGDTVVGSDVWLGWRSVIMPGVSIGHGAVIGVCSVVTNDVPAYAVVAGNPARVIRRRYDETIVDALLDIAWWDWDAATVTRNLEAITGGDIEALRRAT
jgi:virginiamycin A acetyltransferase